MKADVNMQSGRGNAAYDTGSAAVGMAKLGLRTTNIYMASTLRASVSTDPSPRCLIDAF